MSIIKSCFLFFGLTILLLTSCKNIELPSKEESKLKIEYFSKRIDTLHLEALNYEKTFGRIEADLEISLDLDVLNRLLRRFLENRREDIKLIFLPTRPLFIEEKNIFGIKYSNFINLDTGNLEVNIKSLKIFHSSDKSIEATIELEGKGKINVSGKYTGIPVYANPFVEIYMNETIKFEVLPSNDEVIFKPLPKILNLKTRITIKLLNWDVPYYQEIPIQATDLLKPLGIKLGFSGEITLPKPSTNVRNKFELKNYNVNFKSPKIKIEQNRLFYNSNIELNSK